MSERDDRSEIIALLDRYAECLDRRDWAGLDRVFAEDVEFDFGEWRATRREQAVAAMRSYLDGCGPTQHLLGNYRIELDGDRASSRVYVRAFHVGIGQAAGQTYEMGGEYRDRLERRDGRWLSVARVGEPFWEVGSRDVLGPAR
ncbi:MAG TPA: nuclear transport factor 2 family protein [Myxococcota bacterium]|nr:nuclear transport factor 2 family protein [Myxococcota bacterium]